MTKYHAIPTEVDGIRFQSKAEARRYAELRLLQRAGQIADLRVHPRYPLVVNGVKCGYYEADFAYREGEQEVVEDVKGVATAVFQLKAKLVKALHGVTVTIVQA